METTRRDTPDGQPLINSSANEQMPDDDGLQDATRHQTVREREMEIVDPNYDQGFWSWIPPWLRRIMTPKASVLMVGLIGMNTQALHSYFGGCIASMEKQFQIESQITGILGSGWDMGMIAPLILFTYFGTRSHKARWLGYGTLFIAVSCFMKVLPYAIYGPGPNILRLTEEYSDGFNHSIEALPSKTNTPQMCGEHREGELCTFDPMATAAPPIVFLSQLIGGIGDAVYFPLGFAYIDDNFERHLSPVFIAISQCLRQIGPTIGYLVSSIYNKMFVDPWLTPIITNEDPRWVGAWWIGWILFGISTIIISFAMALFPKVTNRNITRTEDNIAMKQAVSFQDFKNTVKRLAVNRVMMLNSFSGLFEILSFAGYWFFMAKYLEALYRRTDSEASFWLGTVGLISTVVGILSSALYIMRFKPIARNVAAWNVFCEGFSVIVFISWAFLGCPIDNMAGNRQADNMLNVTMACNEHCGCIEHTEFDPVCYQEIQQTFYSPCHAGCHSSRMINGTTEYFDCECIPTGKVTSGVCHVDCTANYVIFMILQCLTVLLAASGRTGNTMLHIRCVDDKDKALAVGVSEVLLSAFCFVPAPIIFGAILDYSCIIWTENCDRTGNCLLYDGSRGRYMLNFTCAALALIGCLLDVGVWYYVKELQIYNEDQVQPKVEEDNKRTENELDTT